MFVTKNVQIDSRVRNTTKYDSLIAVICLVENRNFRRRPQTIASDRRQSLIEGHDTIKVTLNVVISTSMCTLVNFILM